MVILSLELTRVNPGPNIFSINVKLTSTFFNSTEVWSVHHLHRSTFEFPSRVNLFGPSFVPYPALWTGLDGATRLTRSDFMLQTG